MYRCKEKTDMTRNKFVKYRLISNLSRCNEVIV